MQNETMERLLMNKNVMMTAVLATMIAGAASADEAADLKALQMQVKLQKQELVDLIAKMEQIEKNQQSAKANAKNADWASKVKIKGDFRYRMEWADGTKSDGREIDKARERIRARIGLDAQVNDEVKYSVRLATGGGNTSTNETLDNDFNSSETYIDRAYITYSPNAVEGLDVMFGRMAKPWYAASDLIFDGDLNPDGIAASYSKGALGLTAGTFVVQEHVNDDIRLNTFQITGDIEPSEDVKATIGATYFGLTNDEQDAGTYDQGYDIAEVFGVAKVNAGLPLTLTGHYSMNAAADEDENAFLVGLSTKTGKWKFGYNYRYVEENATIDEFNDGDFGDGQPGWQGSKLTAGYSISKNFSAGATYFFANEEIDGDGELDLFQIDLKAKF